VPKAWSRQRYVQLALALLMPNVKALIAAHCDSKKSFEGG